MRLVGLTGGIASGKSTVSAEFQSLGIPIIDADKIAHEALRKGTWGWRRVVATFGEGILQPNGEVDRARLGEIIFNDPAQRKLLNKAMKPSIALGILLQILKHWIAGTSVVVLDAPLLFEAGINKLTKPVIVVWVDSATQEARLMGRDGCSREQAHSKVDAQLPLDWKAQHADIVIHNEGDLAGTVVQVHQAWEYLSGPPTCNELLLSRTGVIVLTLGAIFLYFRWVK